MLTTLAVITRLATLLVAMLAWPGVRPELEPVAPEIAASQPQAESEHADEITTADDLLRALETSGNAVHRLSAKVRYVKTFDIQGDTQQRDGRLAFVSTPVDRDVHPETDAEFDRRFAIVFERLELDNGRRIEDESTAYLELYIFDGEWLAEIRPFDKQFIRRQVVAPGEKWDPLRLGEGPFPIPIQQRRADILERFDVELLDGLEDVIERPVRGVAGKCYQLRLTPKPEANEKELREIRVWYQKDTLLPRMAKTISQAGDTSFVLLKNMQTNADAEITEAELTTQPPADRAGWNITVEPYAG
ncbi:MAG: hypothetical protein Q9O74_00825 [Planctomycetota bacterium]|nr:hypothetical protein [Planctomycetota bacterium]